MLKKLVLLLNTIKYLTARQLFYRILYRLKKVTVPSRSILEENTSNSALSNVQLAWRGSEYAPQSIFSTGRATFLNRTANITDKLIWNDESNSKLWLYNLHYFDDLNAIGSKSRLSEQQVFINRWIDENSENKGNGWEPYTLSLRLVNLVKWCGKNEIYDKNIIISIIQQAKALEQLCEYHILANHLFANAKALVFVGEFLGELGDRFFEKGISILEEEVSEQFLSDGAHFELSPMYHSVMIWDMLELIELSSISSKGSLKSKKSSWEQVARKGLIWLKSMCHPDKGISFFNDAAMGIAPDPESLLIYAQQLNINELLIEPLTKKVVSHWDVSGFTSVSNERFKLILNHAQIGPNYQPGHAHADTLSFELSVDEKRLFVNSGTSQYGIGKEREYERSTQAHNTLMFNDENSSEVWSGFRVARRACVKNYSCIENNNEVIVSAEHDGYKRFHKEYRHKRKWKLTQLNFIIEDIFPCVVGSKVQTHYHLHPDVTLLEYTNTTITVNLGATGVIILEVSGGSIALEDYSYHPEFGLSIKSKKIVISHSDRSGKCIFSLNLVPNEQKK